MVYTNMIRVNFYLPEPMLEALKGVAKVTGFSASELVRQAISTFLIAPHAREPHADKTRSEGEK